MLTVRAKTLLCIMLLAAIGGTWLAKERLDEAHPKDSFQELLYVPSGAALKMIACGFDAPLADILWVESLMYYSHNLRADKFNHDKKAKYAYVHKLLDIITDLNPRFSKAYLYGGLFLLSTGRETQKHQGLKLLKKGVSAFEREKSGMSKNSKLWQLHMHLALAYEMQMKDRESARKHFRLATEDPECPPEIVTTWENYEYEANVGAGIVERLDTVIAVWENLLKEKQSNKDYQALASARLQKLYRERADIIETKEAEEILTKAFREFTAKNKRPIRTFGELVSGGIIKELPSLPLGNEKRRDQPVILPNGSIKSLLLAEKEADYMKKLLFDSIFVYYNSHGKTFPQNLGKLVEDGILKKLPRHPLASAGYGFRYNPKNGDLEISSPQ